MKKAIRAEILAICIFLLTGCGFIAPSQGYVARKMEKKYGERFEYIDDDEETQQYRYRTSQMAPQEKIAVSYREDVLKDEYASYLLQDDEAEYISKYFDKFFVEYKAYPTIRYLSSDLDANSTLDDLYEANPNIMVYIRFIIPERELTSNSDMNQRMELCCKDIATDGKRYRIVAYPVDDDRYDTFDRSDTADFNNVKDDYWSCSISDGEVKVSDLMD
ncbi:hypothetical protein [Butyrivibrio sp. XPD2006]|uniref:hypothetical protein n=1 Tax=Butyrivibrio sp. XPD2006 TaxID=1280668 RepID=UPI0012DD6957|nr:hypothetical protein [Butyrivibrio sp. XPD2006]